MRLMSGDLRQTLGISFKFPEGSLDVMINQSELGLASASHAHILGEVARRLLELC